MATWNELLRQARKQRELTQAEAARRAEVSLRQVIAYEKGTVTPTRDMLLRLARGLRLDRQAANTLLESAGHQPLPVGRLADLERRSIPLTLMQREIDTYPWPCLIMSDAMEILLLNRPAVWVAEFDFAVALPRPSDRSLIRITAMEHFQEPRVVNWTEIVSTLIAVLKTDFEDSERYAAAIPWFATVVQDLSMQPKYSQGFPRLMALWQTVAPKPDIARTSFPAEWRLSDGTRLSFDCLISSWNDFDSAGAIDWFPANAATADWLAERAAQEAPDMEHQGDSGASGHASPVPALPPWNELLQIAREKCGFTQAALAHAVGISPETVYSYEDGRRTPPRETIIRMTRAMELDGSTTNLIVTGAGREPVASALGRSVAGEPTEDPRYQPSRWQRYVEPTRAVLSEKVAAHRWPCLVFDNQCQTLEVNVAARRVLGTVPVAQSLLQLLVSRGFRGHVVNYDEVVSALAPRSLRRAVTNGRSNGRT
ncbi:MAG TPA: helix-turn-helix transcriptional regulator, partial [Steroidobacteraceae bacterium]|nr:helix-turn-helix transcriptional regulator [Steroidobacteraceae bacterium]